LFWKGVLPWLILGRILLFPKCLPLGTVGVKKEKLFFMPFLNSFCSLGLVMFSNVMFCAADASADALQIPGLDNLPGRDDGVVKVSLDDDEDSVPVQVPHLFTHVKQAFNFFFFFLL
jgi:hypothetical protein